MWAATPTARVERITSTAGRLTEKEADMYRKVLVGYDDTEQSKDALVLGKQLADATGAGLVIAGVFQFDPMWGGFDPRFRDADAEFARSIEVAAKAAGAEPEAVPSSSPQRGLHELAEEIGADMIVLGSARHGRVGQVLAGSTGVSLLHGSPCAVGIAPRGYHERAADDITTVAVGLDGSPESEQALQAAGELAASTYAKLKLVSVAVPPALEAARSGIVGYHELVDTIEQATRNLLAAARAKVADGIDVESTLVTGDPVDSLVNVAGTPGTLLMVGSRGYGPLRRALIGSVSTRLVRSAQSPVIVTPRGAHAPNEDKPVETIEATS
jgi:nucleotide-binding universal stress UspA family protein